MIDRATVGRAGKVLVGVGLLLVLVSRVELADLGDALRSADPAACVAGLLLFTLLQAVEIARLRLAFRRYPISTPGAAHLHFTSLFFANFLPGSLGAEVYKLHLLRRLAGELTRPLALLLLVRVSGLAMLIAMALLYIATAYAHVAAATAIVVEGLRLDGRVLAVAGGVLALGAVMLPALPSGRRALRRARPQLRTAWETVIELGARPLLGLLALGVLVWACRTGAIYWFVRAVDGTPIVLDVLLVVAFVNIVSLLPVSMAALGVREGAIALGLVACGVSLSHALGVALISRGVLWVVSLVGGVLYFARGDVALGAGAAS